MANRAFARPPRPPPRPSARPSGCAENPEHWIPRLPRWERGSGETAFPRGVQGADLKAIGWRTEAEPHLPPNQFFPLDRRLILADTVPTKRPQVDEGRDSPNRNLPIDRRGTDVKWTEVTHECERKDCGPALVALETEPPTCVPIASAGQRRWRGNGGLCAGGGVDAGRDRGPASALLHSAPN